MLSMSKVVCLVAESEEIPDSTMLDPAGVKINWHFLHNS